MNLSYKSKSNEEEDHTFWWPICFLQGTEIRKVAGCFCGVYVWRHWAKMIWFKDRRNHMELTAS